MIGCNRQKTPGMTTTADILNDPLGCAIPPLDELPALAAECASIVTPDNCAPMWQFVMRLPRYDNICFAKALIIADWGGVMKERSSAQPLITATPEFKQFLASIKDITDVVIDDIRSEIETAIDARLLEYGLGPLHRRS